MLSKKLVGLITITGISLLLEISLLSEFMKYIFPPKKLYEGVDY